MEAATCCLCGEVLGSEIRCLADVTPGDSTYLSLIEQILEDEEKELLCFLDSVGEICSACAELIYSIEMYLQKLRDVKVQIINTYASKTQGTPAPNKTDSADKKSTETKSEKSKNKRTREESAEGKKKKKTKKLEEVRIYELRYESPVDSLPAPLDQEDIQADIDFADDATDTAEEFDIVGNVSPASRPSPKPRFMLNKQDNFQDENISILDIILEEANLDSVEIQVDDETWNSIFVKPPQENDCLSMNWRENLLPSIQPYLKHCEVILESVFQDGEFPYFSGFCKGTNCSRTLQVRVLSELRLQLEYSAGECRDPVKAVTKLCDYCLEEFDCDNEDHARAIRDHLTTKHSAEEDRVYSCKCGRTFTRKGSRNFHFKRCTNSDENVTCEYCGKMIRNLARLNLHIKYCKRDVVCEICNKVFSTGKKLEEHIFTVHEDTSMNLHDKREYRCDQCDKVFWKKYNLDSHKMIHSDRKPFLCDIEDCGRRFKRLAAMKQHKVTVHEEKKRFFCKFCAANFKSIKGLQHHVSVAHNIGPSVEKNFACPHCNKAFRCLADLKTHVVTHTKEKAFSCEICGQKFTRNGSLTDHMMVHKKKFQCEWCDKCFGRERYLKGHLRNCQLNPNKVKEDKAASEAGQQTAQQDTVIITKGDNLGHLEVPYTQEAKPNSVEHVVEVLAKPNLGEPNIELEKNTNIVLINPSSFKAEGEPIQLIQAPGGQVLALTMLKECETVKLIRTGAGDVFPPEPF